MAYKAPKKNRIYHIYNRGNRRCVIGKCKKDYDYLYSLIKDIFNVRNYELFCFCIMPNHYHILASQTGDQTISRGMHIINSAYAKYFNTKYGLSGHLFQGTYHRKWVIGRDSMILTYAYIVNNPKKLKSIDFEKYPWLYDNRFLLKNYLARRILDQSTDEFQTL